MSVRGWSAGGVGLAVVALLIAIAFWGGGGDAEHGGNSPLRFKTKAAIPEASGKMPRSEIRIAPESGGRRESADATVKAKPLKSATAEQEDDALLDEVIDGLVAQLSAAVKKGDRRQVLDLIRRLKAMGYGGLSADGRARSGGSSVKARILQSLAEAGPDALTAVMDLLSDPEPSVAEAAKSLLFDKLSDISLNDSTRAELVTAAAAEMTDTISLERLYVEFIKMRPSVGVDAFTKILSSGTEEARSILPRIMANFTADPTVTTAADLKDWLQDHGDPEDADRRYGGIILQGETEAK